MWGLQFGEGDRNDCRVASEVESVGQNEKKIKALTDAHSTDILQDISELELLMCGPNNEIY